MKAPAGLREDLRGECRQIIEGRVRQEHSLPLIAELAAVYLLPDSQYDIRTGHTPDARRAQGSLAGCQAVIRYPLKLRAPVEPGIAPESCRDPCQLLAVGHILTVRDHPDQPRLDPAPGPAVPPGDLRQVSPAADLNDQLFLLLPCPPGTRPGDGLAFDRRRLARGIGSHRAYPGHR